METVIDKLLIIQGSVFNSVYHAGSVAFSGFSMAPTYVQSGFSVFITSSIALTKDLSDKLMHLAAFMASDSWSQIGIISAFTIIGLGIVIGNKKRHRQSPMTGEFPVPDPQGRRDRIGTFLCVYLPLLYGAELSTIFFWPSLGILLHFGIIFLTLGYEGIGKDKPDEVRYLLYTFPLISILRIANLGLPLYDFPPLLSIIVVNSVVLIGIFLTIQMEPKILAGLFRRLPRKNLPELAICLTISLPLGFLGYHTLKPDLIGVVSPVGLAITLFIFVGLTEEILFRGFLQRWLVPIMGTKTGLIVSSLVNTAMVIIWGSAPYTCFVFVTALFLGILFHRNHNIAIVVICHGLIDLSLFGYPMVFPV